MYEDEKQDELPALPLNDALEAIAVVNNSLITEGMSHYIVTVLRVLGNHFRFSFFFINNGIGYPYSLSNYLSWVISQIFYHYLRSASLSKKYCFLFNAGVPLHQRIDLQTFTLLLAFSEKVVALGGFFDVHVDRVDYPNLLSCVVRAKRMYRLLLKDEQHQQCVHVDDFFIELQAAQIPFDKRIFARLTNNKNMMDFLDYLAYFPLFIHTHTNIIDSPVR